MVTDRAPYVVLLIRRVDYVSARVIHYQFNPVR